MPPPPTSPPPESPTIETAPAVEIQLKSLSSRTASNKKVTETDNDDADDDDEDDDDDEEGSMFASNAMPHRKKFETQKFCGIFKRQRRSNLDNKFEQKMILPANSNALHIKAFQLRFLHVRF